MDVITNRDDLNPDMTPGACTHRPMARQLGGDASRWTCMDCGLEVGTDDIGRPLRAIHPLWPLDRVPGSAPMTNLTEDLARVRVELNEVKQELAAFEALLCWCQPARQHSDYNQPTKYMHAADCIVAAAQQAAAQQ